MSTLFERQASDILADSWSNYDTRNVPVCPCFKFNGDPVPELFSSPAIQAPQISGTVVPNGTRSKMGLCPRMIICPGEDSGFEITGKE